MNAAIPGDTPQASPVAPWGSGARLMRAVMTGIALVALMGVIVSMLAGALVITSNSVGVPFGERVTATVQERTVLPAKPARRWSPYSYEGSRCETARFHVTWTDGTGRFDVCTDRHLADLQVGDEVRVQTIPWSNEVLPEGEGGGGLPVALLAIAAAAFALSTRSALRYRHLARFGASGPSYSGWVESVNRNSIRVRIDDEHPRELIMLPAVYKFPMNPGDPITIWASGRTRLRRRPHGPWISRCRNRIDVFTHAWRRRARGRPRRDGAE